MLTNWITRRRAAAAPRLEAGLPGPGPTGAADLRTLPQVATTAMAAHLQDVADAVTQAATTASADETAPQEPLTHARSPRPSNSDKGPYLDFGSRTPETAPDRHAATPEVIRLHAELHRAQERIAALDRQLQQLQAANDAAYAADYDTAGGPQLDAGQPFGTLPARRPGRAINLRKGAL